LLQVNLLTDEMFESARAGPHTRKWAQRLRRNARRVRCQSRQRVAV